MRKIDIFGIKDKVKKEAQELIKSFESMGMALEDGAKDAFIRDRVQRTFELLGLEAPEYSDRVIGFGFVPPASNSSYGRFKSDWGLEYSGMGFVLDDNADDRMRDFKERKRLAGLRIKEASASNPCELIRNFTLRKTPRLTNRYSLKPHQEEGVAWLQTLYSRGSFDGCLMADDMGLGKTLQVLYFLDWLAYTDSSCGPFLVVAPVSVLDNWKKEFHDFFQDSPLKVNILKARDVLYSYVPQRVQAMQSQDIIITSYESLKKSQLNFAAVKFDVVVLDEAQKIKNPTAEITTTAKALNAKFKIALTGTPVENSLRDLWSIMDFAAPGLVGIESEFVGKYKIKRNAEAADYEKVGNQIRTQLGLHFLRRLKKDVLSSLPAMDTKKICEEMPVEQEAEYQRVMADYLPGTNELATIQGLKTVSEHPYLNDDTILARSTDEIINASARLMVTMKILEEIKQRGEKVIVFVERRKLQTALKKIILEKFDLTVNVVNGDTPTGDKCHNSRQKLIDDFENTKGFNIIIMSPLAAGVGLNVVGANNVIHYSRLWNPAKESQATDRVYRIGQTKDVHVYYPMAIRAQGKCFDETLDYLLKRKQELAEAACYPSQKLDVTNDELVKELLTTEAMPSSDKKLY